MMKPESRTAEQGAVGPLSEQAERDLIGQCARGDSRAFDALMLANHAQVFRLAYRFTGDRDEAEMVTQDTFIQAFRSLKDFDGRSRLMTWLYSIAARKAIDRRRRRRVEERTQPLAEDADPASDGRRARAPDPAEQLEGKELQEQLRDAMARLPADQRAALALVTQEGMDYNAAARVMRCSRGTIAWRVFNARRLLREMLSGYLGTESG